MTSPDLPIARTVALLVFLTAGCGGDSGSAERAGGSRAAAAQDPADTTGVDDGFEPSADQFGLERFTITTETYRAPVQVGLRKMRESRTTVTRYVEGYGERIAMETRSDRRHEQYYWDGRRGILHDVANQTTVDQGGVRLKTSEPGQHAVASESLLANWGYARSGDKPVLGRPCEVWTSQEHKTEFCRWRHLVLESRDWNADGEETGRMTVVEIREGEGIPAEFESLAERL